MSDKSWFEMTWKEREARFREFVASFPVGCRVRVLESDLDEYEGVTGVVEGHDPGDRDSLPLASVAFDEPVCAAVHQDGSKEWMTGDGFYEDEIELLEDR